MLVNLAIFHREPVVVPFEAEEDISTKDVVYTCFLQGLTVGFRLPREIFEDDRENEFVEPIQLDIIRMAEDSQKPG